MKKLTFEESVLLADKIFKEKLDAKEVKEEKAPESDSKAPEQDTSTQVQEAPKKPAHKRTRARKTTKQKSSDQE